MIYAENIAVSEFKSRTEGCWDWFGTFWQIISLAKKQRFFKIHFTPEVLYSIFQRMLASQLISFSYIIKKKSTKPQVYFAEKHYLNYEQNILTDRNNFSPKILFLSIFKIFTSQLNSVEK